MNNQKPDGEIYYFSFEGKKYHLTLKTPSTALEAAEAFEWIASKIRKDIEEAKKPSE